MSNPNEMEMLDKQRIEAFIRQDVREYARLCDATGMDPEDSELYRWGIAILNQEKDQKEMSELREKHSEFERTLARKIPIERYKAFLNQAKERKISISDLYSGTAQKRSLLLKFFPEDFAPGKLRDLTSRREHAIGTIFKGVADYAKRRMKEQREQRRAERN
ncbi:MAG: hypothetical protein NTY68_05210 [Candidatus Micrarchaeota archaeon]|nr:hypothetical protein [Candidatus Micrarchaeota archaeon]